MSKILSILMLLMILAGCTSSDQVDKEEIQERSENMDFIIDDLDTFIEEDDQNLNIENIGE